MSASIPLQVKHFSPMNDEHGMGTWYGGSKSPVIYQVAHSVGDGSWRKKTVFWGRLRFTVSLKTGYPGYAMVYPISANESPHVTTCHHCDNFWFREGPLRSERWDLDAVTAGSDTSGSYGWRRAHLTGGLEVDPAKIFCNQKLEDSNIYCKCVTDPDILDIWMHIR